MQRPATIARPSKATRDLVVILCLTFFTWYLATISDRFLDAYFIISLIPGLGLVACAIRLWSNLEHERALRRQAEEWLHATRASEVREPEPGPARTRPGGGAHSDPYATLTDREVEVLTLIASGCTNLHIAETLSISLNTVERHSANLYRKLGARGRVEATHYAVVRGLVTEDSLRCCQETDGEV
jgi:DNA-binding CsgD family transcriptional regulator